MLCTLEAAGYGQHFVHFFAFVCSCPALLSVSCIHLSWGVIALGHAMAQAYWFNERIWVGSLQFVNWQISMSAVVDARWRWNWSEFLQTLDCLERYGMDALMQSSNITKSAQICSHRLEVLQHVQPMWRPACVIIAHAKLSCTLFADDWQYLSAHKTMYNSFRKKSIGFWPNCRPSPIRSTLSLHQVAILIAALAQLRDYTCQFTWCLDNNRLYT